MDRNPSNKQTTDRSWRLLDVVRGDGQSSYESVPPQAAAVLVFLLLAHYQKAGDVLALRGEDLRELAINTLAVSAGERKQPTAAYTLDPVQRTLLDAPLAVLEECVEWATEFDISTPDGRAAASMALDELIAEVANRSRWTEYFTPSGIVELMVALADPKPGDRIYDPCFGSAGLLAAASRHAEETMSDHVPGGAISGVEINGSAYTIGLARLLLGSAPVERLKHANALTADPGITYDLVLAVPPWGYRDATESEFLQLAMDALGPEGRAVIALPRGFYFQERTVALRNRLLSEFRVEGVVSLPERVFGSLTSIQSALLVFSKPAKTSAAGLAYPVRFLDLGHPANRTLFSNQRSKTTVLTSHGVHEANRRFHADVPAYDLWEESSAELLDTSWDQFISRRGEFELNEFLEQLSVVDPTIGVHRLQEIAHVSQGASRKMLAGETHEESQPIVPVATPGDLRDGKVLRPRSFTSTATADLQDEWRLQQGDVVLALSGRGASLEVGVVPRELIGAFASRELAIIRLHGFAVFGETYPDPDYLAVILQSYVYQVWLSGHGSGSTIQRLSRSALENLPIVLPRTHVQMLVVSRWRESGGDGTQILKDVLLGLSRDPLQSWAESTFATFYATHLDYYQRSYVEILRDLNHSYIDQWHKHHDQYSTSTESTLGPWFEELEHASVELGALDDNLPVTMQVLVMQNAWILMEHALNLDTMEPGSTDSRAPRIAVELTWHMQLNIEYAINEIVSAGVAVDAWLQPSVVPSGRHTQTELHIRNSGNTALRNFRVTLAPLGKEPVLVGVLDIGAVATIPIDIPGGAPGGLWSVVVNWFGVRIDRHSTSGEVNLSVSYGDTLGDQQTDIGKSPYIAGTPIHRADMLFGRKNMLIEIGHLLSAEHSNVLFLEGNRRTGKTSLLKQLLIDGRLEQCVPVYFDAQALESLVATEIFRLLTVETAVALWKAGYDAWFKDDLPIDGSRPFPQAVRRALADVYGNESRPFEQFQEYIQLALDVIAPKRLLIMFDEVDKFQDGIERREMDATVLANFRHLLHTHPALAAIFTGSLRLRRLREDYGSALFGLGQKITVGRLDPESARNLVSEPVRNRLEYSVAARERIVELCGGQPFLIQQLCNIIFENASQAKKAVVDIADVNKALDRFLENEHFRTMWNIAGSSVRQLLLVVCAGVDDKPDPRTLDFLKYRLEELDMHPNIVSEIPGHLDYLEEMDLIALDRQGGLPVYELTVPALARWLRDNIDEHRLIDSVREEE